MLVGLCIKYVSVVAGYYISDETGREWRWRVGRRTVDCKKGLGLRFHFGSSASRLLKPIHLAINPLKRGGFCAGVRFAFQLQRIFTGIVWFLPKVSFRNCAKM